MAYIRNYDASGMGLYMVGDSALPNYGDQATFMGSTPLGNNRFLEYYQDPYSSLNYTTLANYSYADPILERVDFFDGRAIIVKVSNLFAAISKVYGDPQSLLAGADEIVGNKFNDLIQGYGGRDILRGNAGSDVLRGGGGSDKLEGGAGSDKLYAGSGQDVLNGGSGKDTLYGGTDTAGDDFVFRSRFDSAAGSNRDAIVNFTAGSDDIDLRGIDARASTTGTNEAFAWAGNSSAAHSVWWTSTSEGVLLKADVTGDKTADFEILLKSAASLGANDLLL